MSSLLSSLFSSKQALSYNATLCQIGAILALKLNILHVLTIRSRLITDDPTTAREGRWTEDSVFFSGGSLTWLTLPFFPFGYAFSIQRLAGAVRNALENEPMFMALAIAYGMAGTPDALSITLLRTFCVSRIGHAVCFVTGIPQPFRVGFYLGGLMSSAGLAFKALGF